MECVLKTYHRMRLILSIIFFHTVSPPAQAVGGLIAGRALQPSFSQSMITPYTRNYIDRNLKQHKYKETIAYIDEELKKSPNNTELLFQKAAIYADLEQYKKGLAVLKQIKALDPNHVKANKLEKKLEILFIEQKKKLPHNEIGFDQDEAFATDVHNLWTFSSLHYFRFTDGGSYGGRITYGRRYGKTGELYQLEAYPIFTDWATAYISLSYANKSQIIFPQYQYAIEPYFSLPHGFEISVGQRYLQTLDVNIYNYTASIAKYLGQWVVTFRT